MTEVVRLLERLVKAVEESNQLRRIEMRANGTLKAGTDPDRDRGR